MNKKILEESSGPLSNFLLNELIEKKESKMRFDKSKKNNTINKGMSGKAPNIKLINPNASNTVKVKGGSAINNINLIKDSDSESIATAEPENDSEFDSPENTPIKKPVKKAFPKMPTIDADEFKYFTNNKKQKPVIAKEESEEEEESEDDYSASEDESEAESESAASSAPSIKQKKMSSREIEQRKQELLIKLLAL